MKCKQWPKHIPKPMERCSLSKWLGHRIEMQNTIVKHVGMCIVQRFSCAHWHIDINFFSDFRSIKCVRHVVMYEMPYKMNTLIRSVCIGCLSDCISSFNCWKLFQRKGFSAIHTQAHTQSYIYTHTHKRTNANDNLIFILKWKPVETVTLTHNFMKWNFFAFVAHELRHKSNSECATMC